MILVLLLVLPHERLLHVTGQRKDLESRLTAVDIVKCHRSLDLGIPIVSLLQIDHTVDTIVAYSLAHHQIHHSVEERKRWPRSVPSVTSLVSTMRCLLKATHGIVILIHHKKNHVSDHRMMSVDFLLPFL